MSNVTFALGLPHTPWKEERAASFARLCTVLGIGRPAEGPSNAIVSPFHEQFVAGRVFDEKKPNREWSLDLWRWAAGTDATHLLQLQDDIVPAPNFWPMLQAMVTAQPNEVIGLQSQHPTGRNLAQIGRRWYRTCAWLVGPQYVLPTTLLREMLAWLEAHPAVVEQSIGEDVTISTWVRATNRTVWHPLPAIADVDLTVPSTYEGNDRHDHRRPCVTWHGYNAAQLESVEYWTPPTNVEIVPGPSSGECSYCDLNQPAYARSVRGVGICKRCIADILSGMLSKA